MRRIGSLSDQSLAKRFCDYLVTLSIDAAAEEDTGDQGSTWDIWIRDEKHVQLAREELDSFQQSPQDQRFQVGEKADRIRDERVADNQRRLKHQKNFGKSMTSRQAMSGPLAGATVRQQNIPVTIAILVLSILASFSANFAQPRPSRTPGDYSLEQKVYFALSFADQREYAETGDPFEAIKRGEVWRLITPMFLHGNMFHLAFNMLWMFFLVQRSNGCMVRCSWRCWFW